jgi:hypothetical protein
MSGIHDLKKVAELGAVSIYRTSPYAEQHRATLREKSKTLSNGVQKL